MAVLWWEHGVCVVCTKQRCFPNKITADSMRVSSPRLVQKTNMLKHCIIVGYLGRTALDDDRSGGLVDGMEWCGLGWGRGWGWGFGRGRGMGRGGWGGEGQPFHFRLQQHDDGNVRLLRETSVFC